MTIERGGNDPDVCRGCGRAVTTVPDGCRGCLPQHVARLAAWLGSDGRMDPDEREVAAALTVEQLAEYRAVRAEIDAACRRIETLALALCPRAGEFEW